VSELVFSKPMIRRGRAGQGSAVQWDIHKGVAIGGVHIAGMVKRRDAQPDMG